MRSRVHRYGIPPSIRRRGFALVRAPRRATSRFRTLPDFLILGGQRCGTTSLFRHLERDPSVRSGLRKEVSFFCTNFARGEDWYRAHFPTELARSAWRRQHGVKPAIGEATPYYLFHPAAPARAASVVPDAKLVVLLRNPVDRALSGWGLQRAIGTEPLSFEEALDREDERLAGEEQRLLADPAYRSHSHRHHSYKARGRYAEQLDRWFAHYPRDRFLILSSEEYFSDPGETARRTIEFLGLPSRSLPGLRSTSASTSGEHLAPSLRERLAAEFAAPNRRLYELLGRDFGWQ
jgi:hypothetical protein